MSPSYEVAFSFFSQGERNTHDATFLFSCFTAGGIVSASSKGCGGKALSRGPYSKLDPNGPLGVVFFEYDGEPRL